MVSARFEEILETKPDGTLDSQLQNCEKTHFCCLAHLASGILFWDHKQMNAKVL